MNAIRVETTSPLIPSEVISWALEFLERAIQASTIEFPKPVTVILRDPTSEDGLAESNEAYRLIVQSGDHLKIEVAAAGERGFSYALTEVAARLFDGAPDRLEGDETGAPAVPIRGIQRAYVSHVEDDHWFHNRRFWMEYLDHLAAQRFNRFHLALGMGYNYWEPSAPTENYFCFPYPFLLNVPGHRVRVQGVSVSERDRNLAQLQFIAAETARRGISFQLGLWNQAWDYLDGASDGLAPELTYPVLGISNENHAEYCAAAVRMLLDAVPEISGLSFRVHYEGGIEEDMRGRFWNQVFDAISSVARPVQVDMHAKGVDDELLAAVKRPHIAPVLSAKYWAEHMGLPYHQAGIRPSEHNLTPPEKAGFDIVTSYARRFTRYGYADFLDEQRGVDVMFRIWPGTQKFLLWGDPEMAAGYARTTTISGSLGLDICEPLFFKGRKGSGIPGGRDLYAREDLRLGDDDWVKYRYTYAVWGRYLYDPCTPSHVTDRILRRDHGELANAIRDALRPLSRVLPLVTTVHGVGASNNGFSPELYLDLPISEGLPTAAAQHYASDLGTAPGNWGKVSPFDPETFYGIDEYANDVLLQSPSARYTPLEVAAWIEQLVTDAEEVLPSDFLERPHLNAQTTRAIIDIEVVKRLGHYFAGKLRAAVDYSLFQRTSDRTLLASALQHLRLAHAAYGSIINITEGIYRDDIAFGPETGERGHWKRSARDLHLDIDALHRSLEVAPEGPRAHLNHRMDRALTAARPESEPRFSRGTQFEVSLLGAAPSSNATIRYRTLNQAENWKEAAMSWAGKKLVGAIPATDTDTTYPLQYRIDLQEPECLPVMIPSLEPGTLAGQPYVIVHSDTWRS